MAAQPSTQQQLLNGLKVVIFTNPGDQKFLMRLRINSGAAFDLAGKDGTIALLGDALTPEANTRQDITEEMGGRFTVTTSYDAIDFIIEGRPADFERYVEFLRAALIAPPLNAEAVDKLRSARSAVLKQTNAVPGALADRAVALRLFGDHPYGRPAPGSVESLTRVERADLIFARERLLHPNNATLIVAGSVEEKRVMRALRQLLGFWRQSERIAPPTFKQPGPFDGRTLIIDLPLSESAEVRLAARGFPQSSRDAIAAELLATIALERWREAFPESQGLTLFTRHEARALTGVFTMGASVPTASVSKALETARQVARSLTTAPPSPPEMTRAKTEFQSRLAKEDPRMVLIERWLDADQFKLPKNYDPLLAADRITAEEVKQAATKLFPDEHAATIAVGNASQLRAQLEKLGSVEVLGAVAPASTVQPPAAKPAKLKAPLPRPLLRP